MSSALLFCSQWGTYSSLMSFIFPESDSRRSRSAAALTEYGYAEHIEGFGFFIISLSSRLHKLDKGGLLRFKIIAIKRGCYGGVTKRCCLLFRDSLELEYNTNVLYLGE
jgi:hypothetical protein